MQGFKFNVQTFDNDGNLLNDDNYKTISKIAEAYKHIPYATIYYITHYSDTGRKPSKKIKHIMDRFRITQLSNDEIFEKST
jgi:hypothetical protein